MAVSGLCTNSMLYNEIVDVSIFLILIINIVIIKDIYLDLESEIHVPRCVLKLPLYHHPRDLSSLICGLSIDN